MGRKHDKILDVIDWLIILSCEFLDVIDCCVELVIVCESKGIVHKWCLIKFPREGNFPSTL